MIEIFKCKDCGCIMVVDKKMLWRCRSCSSCESTNIELFTCNEDEEIM